MTFTLSKHIDRNGNRALKVSLDTGAKGFSVQTNGNLPRTHAQGGQFNKAIAQAELYVFVAEFGTDRQKSILGVK